MINIKYQPRGGGTGCVDNGRRLVILLKSSVGFFRIVDPAEEPLKKWCEEPTVPTCLGVFEVLANYLAEILAWYSRRVVRLISAVRFSKSPG